MADYSKIGSENAELLQAIIDGETYDGEATSRNAAILKSIIDKEEYTDAPQSKIEELLIQLKAVIESGGGSSFPIYDFHETQDKKIVVRRKFDYVKGEMQVQTLWFFNGFIFENYLIDVPSELVDFLKARADISGKSYSDNTSGTQNGWVGIATDYYNKKLICYNSRWLQQSGVPMWAVIDNDGGAEQTLEWSDPYDV